MNCLKCSNPFPTKLMVDGKERNFQRRKYCLVCSPFGKHNTRKISILFVSKKCKDCGNPLLSTRRNRCNNCNVVRFRQNLKRKLVEYKGGSCKICGYNRCIRNLVFHHLDPDEKEYNVSGLTKSFEKLRKEVDKCVLLCCLCHGEVHDGLISIPE